MVKMFVCETNADRAIAIKINGKWFLNSCAPNGKWGDIDITKAKAKNIAKAISNAIKLKNYNSPDEIAIDAIHEINGWNEIEAYEGMSAAEIEIYENDNRTFDLTLFYEINYEE